MAAKIRKGDTVIVLTGKDKRRTGEVIDVDPAGGTARVSGMRIAVHHRKQTPGAEGGRIPEEKPIDLSNLAFFDTESNRATRVGFRFEDGRKVRYSKRTGKTIDE